MGNTDSLRVIVFKEGDVWIAQGLEIDICAQGPDLKAVKERFLVTLRSEIEHGDPSSIGPGPDEFFSLWAKRSDFVNKLRERGGMPVEIAVAA
ncbi:MAG: hypothetical protein K8F92_04355 [Hyphomicrobium sp.]|uniref:hypothetical protein n=1 Tax=Hyphomicrobium sp. TaxID=82 RepID=UPI001322A32C|nr:hypothetical protein [Hyphomicrobium sp.]KAB2943963.1 MAG: hypothetical protein F9K20_00625 [Hyphomicrobium sp.]MBZ0208871.1 hypothetical protein [Hyphomicrobium sp.]